MLQDTPVREEEAYISVTASVVTPATPVNHEPSDSFSVT
jgi:hypothetical protein